MKKDVQLKSIVKALKQKYGDEAAVLLASPEFHSNAAYGLSTQSLALDCLIGRPGLPCGRVVEISGLEGAGKSTLGEHLIAECQRKGGIVCLIESEHGRDLVRMQKMGIETENIITLQPENLELGFQMLETVIEKVRKVYGKQVPFLILWDSIAQTQTQAEEKDSFTDSHIASHAKLISQACRKLLGTFAKEHLFMVFINQLKTKINVFGYGDPYTTFGGKAISYVSSVTFRARRAQEITGPKKKAIGYVMKVKIWKNKVGDPKNECEIKVNYKTGINQEMDLYETALKFGLLQKNGRTYVFKGKSVTEETWPILVKEMGGVGLMRDCLLQRAIKKGVIVPYGMQQEAQQSDTKKASRAPGAKKTLATKEKT